MTPLGYIYDPTANDTQSKVRGIGRYFQTLEEAFHIEKIAAQTGMSLPDRTDLPSLSALTDIHKVPKNSLFINPFFNFVQKPLKIGRIGRKQIAVIHDLIPLKYAHYYPTGFKGAVYKYLNKWSLKNYDLIVTCSEVSKKDIMFYLKIPEKKIKVIYPSVSSLFLPHLDTSEESPIHHHPFHSENGHSIAEFDQIPLEKMTTNQSLLKLPDFILYVGDATWNKNLPLLAQAVRMANIPCVCVGSVFTQAGTKALSTKVHPWMKSFQSFLQLTQQSNLFIFPGYVSDLDLLYLYKRARLNILPSIDEGFGYSFIEAGYMGTPSVLSDTPIFHEIAHTAALFAKVNDPKDMVQKIIELFYDNEQHKKMSIKAFDRAQEFTPAKFRAGWLAAVQSLST